MSLLIVRQLHSVVELRRQAGAWDDLWRRSASTLPTSRAEMVATWCEHFTPQGKFCAIAIERDGQWIASLPLCGRRVRGLRVATLPGNEWSPSGELLIDSNVDLLEVTNLLLSTLRHLGWPLLTIKAAPLAAPNWQPFLLACQLQHRSVSRRRQFEVNVVDIAADWPTYFATRTKNHRRYLRRAESLASHRKIELEHLCEISPEHVGPLLQSCFEVERSGWKGREGSAVLTAPGAWEFYLAQARHLAACGELRITRLLDQSRPVAFEYGWLTNGVYASLKVGYDEAFAALSPGQLLRKRLLERFHATHEARAVDFLGPSCPATARWATRRYALDRLHVSLAGASAQAAVWLHREVWARLSARRHSAAEGDVRSNITPTLRVELR